MLGVTDLGNVFLAMLMVQMFVVLESIKIMQERNVYIFFDKQHSYCNNTAQCLKSTYGNAQSTKCPPVLCNSYANCRDCITGGINIFHLSLFEFNFSINSLLGCGWCDSTQTCQPIGINGVDSCDLGGCANASSCFKNYLDPSQNASADKCTPVKCGTFSNCQDCAKQGNVVIY